MKDSISYSDETIGFSPLKRGEEKPLCIVSGKRAHLVWGIDDKSHVVIGTKFQPRKKMVSNQGKNGN